ncbi:MAG TPA: NADP-dependent oxidoreductase [Actinomycetes bacterium]|nr:NADP-dependent oxidoreductase [Actinomycetes bacterium]
MAQQPSMTAVRAYVDAGTPRLAVETAPRPVPGIGDVLVAVRAASLTPTELGWPSTWTDRVGRDRSPVIPGHEFSGVVVALGPGTTGLGVGDPVFGLADWYRDGAAAGYLAVEARNVAAKPLTLNHAEAACVPLAASTAWQALFVHGRLRDGQRVLIHGAAGGVGVFAVQLARSAGATVIGTCRSAGRAALLHDLGASEVVDVDRERFEDVGPVDLVLDLVGDDVAQRSWPLVRPGGTLVTVVGGVPRGRPRADARWVWFVVEADRRLLAELARSIDEGELRPVLGAVFPLYDAPRAFGAKLRGGVLGKVALQVVDED